MSNCDLCNRKLKYKEVVIAYHNKRTNTRFVECLPCAEASPDVKEKQDVEWEVHEYPTTISKNL